jgi:hypothetical protein
MSIVASRYARTKQRSLTTTGHLFERRYRARLVDADRYLMELVRYIHLNPVRARMVAAPVDYRWSSHRAYLGAPCPGWLRADVVLGRLGSSVEAARNAYLHFMAEPPDAAEHAELSPARPTSRKARADRELSGTPADQHWHPKVAGTLESIAADLAREHGFTTEDLRSKQRRRDLVQARGVFTSRALREGVANLTQIARYLNRSPSTLSDLLHGRR